jgi:hypothetical protein
MQVLKIHICLWLNLLVIDIVMCKRTRIFKTRNADIKISTL